MAKKTLALFDVDGTLTVPRNVREAYSTALDMFQGQHVTYGCPDLLAGSLAGDACFPAGPAQGGVTP
jgi:hypothetical protein